MACDSGVSDVDTARAKALTASASVAFVVVKRRLLPSQKLTTLMSTLSATASRHRLLGLKLEVDNVELMGLPLASHIRAPSRKLALASASKLRPAERVVLASSRSAINATKLNAVAVRALVVRNAFDGTDMPVVAAASASMAVGGEAWADDELGARLAPLRRALTRYRPPFSRRVVSAATNELVGEVHVANKLLTLKLLSKPNLSFKPKLVCARCGSKAMACVVTQ